MVQSEARQLAARAGELLVCGYPEPGPPSEAFLAHLAAGRIGGVILFSRNLPTLEATAEATRAVHRAGGEDLPVAVDEEGGRTQRLPPPWPCLPSSMALAAAADAPAVEQLGRLLGRALRATGFTQDYAPVLDVNNNPDNPVIGTRSFGDDPEKVAALGVAMIRGLQSAGVVATAKHFPGHGDTAIDSHLDLPVLPFAPDRLRRLELVPFAAAVRAGVRSIMTAHVALPALAEAADLPATLSAAVLTGLLRQELGFQGLIVTDCLEMAAIRDRVGTAAAAVRAVAAGADQVLVSHTESLQEAARLALEEAIADGRLPVERVRDALDRVAAVRAAVRQAPPPPALAEVLGPLARLADRLGEAAVYRAAGAPSAPSGDIWAVVPQAAESPPRWRRLGAAGRAVAGALREGRPPDRVHVVAIGRDGGAVAEVPADGAVIVALPSLRQNPGWMATWRSLAGRRRTALVLEDPYDADRLEGAVQVVVCGDPFEAAVRRGAQVALGAAHPEGHPSVRLRARPGEPLSAATFTALEAPAGRDPQ